MALGAVDTEAWAPQMRSSLSWSLVSVGKQAQQSLSSRYYGELKLLCFGIGNDGLENRVDGQR